MGGMSGDFLAFQEILPGDKLQVLHRDSTKDFASSNCIPDLMRYAITTAGLLHK